VTYAPVEFRDKDHRGFDLDIFYLHVQRTSPV
jgi:hypothetical protein